jgi:ABC-2 type transport system permease protein
VLDRLITGRVRSLERGLVRDMFETVWAILKSYFTAELLRSHGLVFGLLSMALWITLFVMPIVLFAPPNTPGTIISGYIFTAVLVFMSYSMATWDWAWELRWLMMNGMLEHIIISGRSIFLHYVGVLPVSFTWLGLSLGIVYGLLTALIAPPLQTIHDPLSLLIGLTILLTVLFAHAMILGGTTVSTGTSGPVMEMIGWILPIATGGLTPLSRLPRILQLFALYTPYSYPAEIIRYGLIGSQPIISLQKEYLIGSIYGILYFIFSLFYFRIQLRKLLKEGPKTVAMY